MVKNSEYRPILVVPCVMSKKKIKFLLPNEVKIVDGAWLKFTKKVVGLCNGMLSVADIALNLGVNEALVIEILDYLDDDGIITDSREQYKHFNQVDSFPTLFTHSRTKDEIERLHEIVEWNFKSSKPRKRVDLKLFDLLEKRRSCRDFLPKDMTLTQVRTLCQAGYGMLKSGHIAVPSAGGLYPIRIYVSVPKRMNEFADVLEPGYYLYYPIDDSLERIVEDADVEQLKYCFNNEDMIENTIQIVITAYVDFTGFKYANRAYRFCLLEAGHVAQNITLAAIEMGLQSCEMGGVLDEAIKEEMGITEGDIPLLSMVVGYPGIPTEPFDYYGFIEQNVGEDLPVKNVSVKTDCDEFYTATAQYDDGFGGICVANGRARSAALASLKALVEGYERYAMRRNPDTNNSCGIAAHLCGDDAKLAAKLELIERDAIMHCWESKTPPAKFTPKGIHAFRRMNDFEFDKTRNIEFLKINSPLAPDLPVVLVTITGTEYPYFVCGACCDPDQERAENQALMEAMSALSYYSSNPEEDKAPRLRDIETAEDHGALYRLSKKAYKQIEWLSAGRYVDDAFSDNSIVPSDEELGITYQTIGEFDNGIVVVQAQSTKLTPMSFGTYGKKVFPHFFA